VREKGREEKRREERRQKAEKRINIHRDEIRGEEEGKGRRGGKNCRFTAARLPADKVSQDKKKKSPKTTTNTSAQRRRLIMDGRGQT